MFHLIHVIALNSFLFYLHLNLEKTSREKDWMKRWKKNERSRREVESLSYSSFWMVIHDDRTYFGMKRGEKEEKVPLTTCYHLPPLSLIPPLPSQVIVSWSWFEMGRETKRTESGSEMDLEARGREAVNYLSFYDWSKSVIWTNSCVISNYLLLFPSSSSQWVLIQSQIEKSVVCISLSPCEVLPCKLSRDGGESFLWV